MQTTVRKYTKTGIQAPTGTEWRREYKKLQRRKAGKKTRLELKQAAQEKQIAHQLTRPQKLHDAHVKRFFYLQMKRKKYANRYAANPKKEIERSSQRKKALPDSYVAQQLKAMGIPAPLICPQLIELKRESMQFRRIAKEVKTAVTNHLKENHETITEHT
jgi:hypothetical protein